MSAPPKTIANPEYEKWLVERRRASMPARGEFDEDYFPAEYDKDITADGAWILMLMTVQVGRKQYDGQIEHINVPRLSIWYAMPAKITNGMSQAVIRTPKGDVHVWPHEYKKTDIEKFLEFSEDDGFNTHFLSASGAFDEYALFYLRSRGIPRPQAQRMLLATLKDPNYCYFTFAEELASCFSEGTGVPHLFPHNHARRAAKRTELTSKSSKSRVKWKTQE